MGETAVQQGTWDLLLILMCPAMDLSTIALDNIARDPSTKFGAENRLSPFHGTMAPL